MNAYKIKVIITLPDGDKLTRKKTIDKSVIVKPIDLLNEGHKLLYEAIENNIDKMPDEITMA